MNIEEKIRKIIEKKVQPSLLEHEGNIQLVSYEDGICKVRLLGKCSNCPSAMQTLEELIEPPLKEELPEIRKVILTQETNPELLSFAKKILRHEFP